MLHEKDILSLEKKYWQAMVDKDNETLLSLSDDPCIVTGASGVMQMDKKSFQKMIEAEQNYELHSFEFGDSKVLVLNENTAVIGYKVTEKLTVDGKPIELEAAESSTWIKKNGKWVCAAHSESIAGDPFGRDKRH